MAGRVETELKGALAVLRKLVSHCAAVTGNRKVGSSIVYSAVKRHSRLRVMTDPESLDALLKDVTEEAMRASVIHPDDEDDGFGSSYRKLPFEARACLSLRIQFDLGLVRIAAILDMPEAEVAEVYDLALAALETDLNGVQKTLFRH